jgi:hypothetical protein
MGCRALSYSLHRCLPRTTHTDTQTHGGFLPPSPARDTCVLGLGAQARSAEDFQAFRAQATAEAAQLREKMKRSKVRCGSPWDPVIGSPCLGVCTHCDPNQVCAWGTGCV